jgi:membrane-bound serine protease (ClpP class)
MAFRTLKVFEVTNRETGRVWFMSEEDLHNSNGEWIQGPQLRETNGELLLTVDGTRAHELKLADRPVADFQELRSRLGIPPETRITPLQQTWVDKTVFILNTTGMKVLLLVLGVALLYVELHFMTGVLGLSSVLCFVLFFWSAVLGGTAGWLEITLFVFGIACLALEIFVIPGFGVFGVTGILAMLASLVMALQTFGNFEPGADLNSLLKSVGTVLGAFMGVGILGVALARLLPHTPLYDQMTLGPPGTDDAAPRLRREHDPGELAAGLVGRHGRSLTMLRPAGKAEIDGRVIDVQSEGPFIAADAPIEVVSAQGVRVIVREIAAG